MKKTQVSGNALFLILIAIFLLGALTVLLTRQSSTTDETGETERNSIKASEILRAGTSLEAAVQRLLSQGCSENEISFWTDTNGDGNENASDDYYNPNSPGDKSCHVFDIKGAGLNGNIIKTSWLDTSRSAGSRYGKVLYTGSNVVIDVGTNATPGGIDLMAIFPFVTKEVCAEINKNIGVTLIPQEYGLYNSTAGAWEFKGAFSILGAVGDDTGLPNYSLVIGKKTICVEAASSPIANTYHVYHVLMTR